MVHNVPELTILPEQLPRGVRPYPRGEQRLMLALLSDAIYTYRTRFGRRRGLRQLRELERWFDSTDTSYIFGFESVCDALGLDPENIRTRVIGRPRRDLCRMSSIAHLEIRPLVRLQRAAGE